MWYCAIMNQCPRSRPNLSFYNKALQRELSDRGEITYWIEKTASGRKHHRPNIAVGKEIFSLVKVSWNIRYFFFGIGLSVAMICNYSRGYCFFGIGLSVAMICNYSHWILRIYRDAFITLWNQIIFLTSGAYMPS